MQAGAFQQPKPPVEAYFRIIDEPVLRLTSVDLGATADITSLQEVFDFATGLSGSAQGRHHRRRHRAPWHGRCGAAAGRCAGAIGRAGPGIEVVSHVRGIPKGSRLAVSTTLLACLISVCMRATGQTDSLVGELSEEDKRLVAARAILGEWLGGSGGGWQDSGGAWPGMKLIQGELAGPDDPEYGISRGRLLPSHRIFSMEDVSADTRQRLQDSLVLVHGGLAQDVGPILEMVTEKYLLRSEAEWAARQEAMGILNDVVGLLKKGDIRAIGRATDHNFAGPIETIIPWAGNLYTDLLKQRATEAFGDDFWGFWMLGGMSGGGMGFIFDPTRKAGSPRTDADDHA